MARITKKNHSVLPDTVHLNEELFMAAQEREAFTEKTLKKMQTINAETRSMQEEISQEKQDIFTMKVTAEAELEAAARFRKQAHFTIRWPHLRTRERDATTDPLSKRCRLFI